MLRLYVLLIVCAAMAPLAFSIVTLPAQIVA
jgi:hypothetical protein